MFDKILIANRGEIACRIIKTAKRLGITTVAIYSEADSTAQHAILADEAYCIGPAPAQQSYLNSAAIINVARKANVQAIHPGYGFLSENADFARACLQANIVFIGPSAEAITAMGSKSAAKNIMQQANVPVIPGYHGSEQSAEKLLAAARDIGFPVLIKAAAGGGGKGMRSVLQENQFIEHLNSAKREAKASFNDDNMLIEKLLAEPRHVEIQIFADNHGNVVYLFERDCSIQRRHQKVIEEAPAFHLSAELRAQMGNTAVAAAHAINYRGAGTIEFLLSSEQQFYFMEMNTRLQVEHPVTEMITGLDLVEWQLRVAANEKLPLTQAELSINGHAIETRIYAEDPANNFMPSIGTIEYLHTPTMPHVRIDSGIVAGDAVSIYYDPMLAKLITWGENRTQAIQLLQRALNHYQIIGVTTNIDYLQKIINHADFQDEKISTAFIADHQNELTQAQIISDYTPVLLACLYYLKKPPASDNLWSSNSAWQMNLPAEQQFAVTYQGQIVNVPVTTVANGYIMQLPTGQYQVDGLLQGYELIVYYEQQRLTATIEIVQQQLVITTADFTAIVALYNPALRYERAENPQGQLTAPMPGTVVAVHVAVGQTVKVGDGLMIIEAMKMEHTIYAPNNGIIKDIHYEVGQQVNEGDQLLALETAV